MTACTSWPSTTPARSSRRRARSTALLFPLARFHLGVAITPVTKAETDVIDPEPWIKAFVRGTRTNRDLASSWQPWNDFARSVTEPRREYGIEPRM
jgi:hypothetical protein